MVGLSGPVSLGSKIAGRRRDATRKREARGQFLPSICSYPVGTGSKQPSIWIITGYCVDFICIVSYAKCVWKCGPGGGYWKTVSDVIPLLSREQSEIGMNVTCGEMTPFALFNLPSSSALLITCKCQDMPTISPDMPPGYQRLQKNASSSHSCLLFHLFPF